MITFNQFGDCESDTLGSGSGKCDLQSFGDPTGMLLLSKNWFLAASSATLDEATYKTQLKTLQAFPYVPLFNFEQTTPENEKNTSNTGVLTEIRAGKPQFSFTFDKGSCTHKSLYDKRGKNRWDLAIVFDIGVLFARNVAGTNLVGFDAGMLSIETFRLVQGTDPQSSTAMVQLLNAEQFNARHEFFTWSQLGFDMNQINGVVETNIEYTVAPSASTAFSAKITGGCNVSEVITGLDGITNFRLGGTQAAATAISAVSYNTATDAYDFTLDNALASGDTVQLELFDTANSYLVIEDSLGELFKGKAPLATVA